MALDERGDVAAVRPGQKVAFPMARNGAILRLCRSFADRHHIEDLPLSGLDPRAFGVAHLPPRAQVSGQFLLQHAAGLDEETAIDGFVGTVMISVCGLA